MMSAALRAQLRARIESQAPRFEVPALVDALRLLGYCPSEICFRSRPTLVRQGSVVESVNFDPLAHRVYVWVCIGLQSSQGSLPMYFWDLQLEQRDENLSEFLWFFERPLLGQRFAAEYPEQSGDVFDDWPQTRRMMLLLLRLGSPSGIHWTLSSFFPELEVAVRRTPGTRRLRTPDMELGVSALGTGRTMGGVTDLAVGGVEALLICGEQDDRDAAQWIEEAQRRLKESVLPLLNEQDPYLYLQVQLVLRRKIDNVRLLRDRYVGVHRVHQHGKGQASFEQLLLFQGEVRSGLASEQMNYALPSARRGK